MKVLYDVSHQGYAARVRGGRRGIYRATEGFLLHAVDEPRLDFRLLAGESRTAELNLRYYAAAADPAVARRIVPIGGPSGELNAVLERVLFGAGRRLRPLFGDRSRIWELMAMGPKGLVNRSGPPAVAAREVDVFHSLFAPLPPAGRTGARVDVLTIWDLLPLTMPEHFPNQAGRRAVARAVRSLAPSGGHAVCTAAAVKADLVRAAKIDPDRVHVIPLAASDALFHPVDDPSAIAAVRRKYGVPAGDYLLSLSAIDSRKNLPHLVRCFRRLQADPTAPPVMLVIAGEYTERHRAPLAELEAGSGGQKRILFTGRVADADLAALYSGARAFVFPSLGEGFGLPPLEAMRCGTPVVCSSAPALPEVVGDAALLVDPLDVEALIAALRDVINDDALVARLRERSLARAARFSWRRVIEETVTLYEKLLAAAPHGRAATPARLPSLPG